MPQPSLEELTPEIQLNEHEKNLLKILNENRDGCTFLSEIKNNDAFRNNQSVNLEEILQQLRRRGYINQQKWMKGYSIRYDGIYALNNERAPEVRILKHLKNKGAAWLSEKELAESEPELDESNVKKALLLLEKERLIHKRWRKGYRISLNGLVKLSTQKKLDKDIDDLLSTLAQYYSSKAGSMASLYLATIFGLFALFALIGQFATIILSPVPIPLLVYIPPLLIIFCLVISLLITGFLVGLHYFWYSMLASNAINILVRWSGKNNHGQREIANAEVVFELKPLRKNLGFNLYSFFHGGLGALVLRLLPMGLSYLFIVLFSINFLLSWLP